MMHTKMQSDMKKPILQFRHVTCTSGEHQVMVHDASFTLFERELTAIVGVDGSGKINILRLLGGAKRKLISGEVLLYGQPYAPDCVQDAQRAHVFVTTNSTNLIDELTIYENLTLNNALMPTFGLVNERLLIHEAQNALARFGVDLDVRLRVKALTGMEKCVIELIKFQMLGAKVVAMLFVTVDRSSDQRALFLRVAKQMTQAGVTVLLLVNQYTDILHEVDRLFLLSRQGRIARQYGYGAFTKLELTRYLAGGTPVQKRTPHHMHEQNPIFSARNLTVDDAENVNFDVCAGQVIGLFLPDGKRLDGIPLAIAGVKRYNGKLWMDGRRVVIKSERDAAVLSIALLPSDPKQLYFEDLSVEENIIEPFWDRMGAKTGIIPTGLRRAITDDGQEMMKALQEKYGNAEHGDSFFPVLTRFMLYPYRVIIILHPSRVNDAVKTEMLYALIRKASQRGTAVIVGSARYDELEAVCSKVYTFK